MDAEGFRAVEYDNKEPVALIEYKARGATVRPKDANNTALLRLANRASLPFLIVIYDKDALHFGVLPMNDLAQELTKKAVLTEPGYVEFLHRIRGRTAISTSAPCAASGCDRKDIAEVMR
jgi:hypothetical protein